MENQDLSQYTPAQLAEWFINNRDYLQQAKRHYEETVKPVEDLQDEIQTELQRRLNEAGATSFRTPGGTVVQATTTVYTAEDRAAFGQFIIAQGEWEATSLKPVKDYVEDYRRNNDGQLPPGVSAYTRTTLSVKRPTK